MVWRRLPTVLAIVGALLLSGQTSVGAEEPARRQPAVEQPGVSAAGAGAGERAAAAAPVQLGVLTYNIHHGFPCCGPVDQGLTRIGPIADTVRSWQPDVVVLQEVSQWVAGRGCRNQPGVIADVLGDWNYEMGVNKEKRNPSDSQCAAEHGRPWGFVGNAIISRYPIEWTRNIPLPRDDGVESECPTLVDDGPQRCLLEALIRLPNNQPVIVAVTHLEVGSDPASVTLRRRQVDAVLTHLPTGGAIPTILTGDFNTPPDSGLHGRVENAGYTDQFEAWVGDADDCPNPDTRFLYCTFRADNPDRRPDYVFADTGAAPTFGAVGSSQASDHRPLIVQVAVPSG